MECGAHGEELHCYVGVRDSLHDCRYPPAAIRSTILACCGDAACQVDCSHRSFFYVLTVVPRSASFRLPEIDSAGSMLVLEGFYGSGMFVQGCWQCLGSASSVSFRITDADSQDGSRNHNLKHSSETQRLPGALKLGYNHMILTTS